MQHQPKIGAASETVTLPPLPTPQEPIAVPLTEMPPSKSQALTVTVSVGLVVVEGQRRCARMTRCECDMRQDSCFNLLIGPGRRTLFSRTEMDHRETQRVA